MERIPWPTTHDGETPDTIPYGYSYFSTVWDDHSGYEPRVVGDYVDTSGRMVILVALSPGRVIEVTMVSAGQAPGEAGKALLEALAASNAASPAVPPRERTPAQGPPVQGHQSREATL